MIKMDLKFRKIEFSINGFLSYNGIDRGRFRRYDLIKTSLALELFVMIA
jgi:hypothetical protein